MNEDDPPSQRVIDQPPSCIEFCPAFPSIFVVGTYKLEDNQPLDTAEAAAAQSRSGRVELYQLRSKALSSDFGVSECIDKFEFLDCAVLDLHLHPQDTSLLGVCTSTSQMVFFRLARTTRHESGEEIIEHSMLKVGSLQLGEDDTILATSFAWDRQPTSVNPDYLSFAVTFSSGEVKVLRVQRTVEHVPFGQHDFQILSQTTVNPSHTLEAWTVAFTNSSYLAHNTKLLLTGGDDSVLLVRSLADDTGLTTSPLLKDRKSHNAGVTAILPLEILDTAPVNPRLTLAFLTGSYDEHVRVFTLNKTSPHRGRVAAEMHLGGGVWRLRRLSESFHIYVGGAGVCEVVVLASCMHVGVRVLRITRKQPEPIAEEDRCEWAIEVIGSFTEGHESMCYGADAVHMKSLNLDADGSEQSRRMAFERCAPGQVVVVSTSFYDRKVCVWSFHGNETKTIDERKTIQSLAQKEPCEKSIQKETLDEVD